MAMTPSEYDPAQINISHDDPMSWLINDHTNTSLMCMSPEQILSDLEEELDCGLIFLVIR